MAELFDRAEVADLVQAALDGSIAFVPLIKLADIEGPTPLELHAPGLSSPIVLLAEIAGEPAGDMFPVVLFPLAETHRAPLADFVAAVRRKFGVATESTTREEPPQSSLPPERRSSVPAPRSRPPPPRAASDGELEDPMIGRSLGAGRYLIAGLLGAGGMGRVYLAQHTALSKSIALKVLDSTFQEDPHFAGRFHQEALAASQLDHRNVMRVIDFGQEPDGLLYIAMELLRGDNLAMLMEHEVFPLPRIVHIMTQVCAALAAAHDRDIVHRDMKPENIVLVEGVDDDGRPIELVKVCDFGLAKMQQGESSPVAGPVRKLTVAGTIMGTPQYMSPEQCRGLPTDARTDIYACGIILYELATGRVPFSSDNAMDILGMHCMAPPLSPRVLNPALDPRLDAIILRAMSKDREQRQSSARELRDELRALLTAPVEGFEPTAHVGTFGVSAGRSASVVPRADATIDVAEPAPNAPARTAVPPKSDEVEALVPAAEALINGDQATREGARLALLSVGAPGVRALLRARERSQFEASARSRWVTTIRDAGEEAVEALTEGLAALDPLNSEMDAALAEDLLRAVPDGSDRGLASEANRFVLHNAVGVRRAALGALVSLKAREASPALLRALDDRDPSVQMLAVSGYRKIGGINRAVVEKLDAILEGPNVSDELQAAAAAALSEADAAAKVPAESALLRALQPRARSFMGMLRGDASSAEGALVIEAVAIALLRLGGPAARRAVEKRASQSRGEVKRRLEKVLSAK